MRSVLIVNTSYPPELYGGAESSVRELATDLASSGLRVDVACLSGPTVHLSDGIDAGVRVHRRLSRSLAPLSAPYRSRILKAVWHLGETFRIREYLWLRSMIRGIRPDVVHVNNLTGFGWLGRLAVRRLPTVQTVRDYSLICTSATGEHGGVSCHSGRLCCRILKSPFRLRWMQPDVYVSVSRFVAERVRAAGLVGAVGEDLVAYNCPSIPSSVGFRRDGSLTVGFLGRVSADKGVDVLVAAVEALRSEGMEVVLELAGSASADYLEHLHAEYPTGFHDGWLRLLGHVDPGELLGRCDVLAVPTQWAEPFGRSAAEGLLAGVPVVCSRAGGLPELIDVFGGQMVLVDEFRSPVQWASALRDVANERLPEASQGREHVPTPVEVSLNAYGMALAASRRSAS